MANGVAVELKPSATVAPAAQPPQAPSATPIEIQVGLATANAVVGVAAAMESFQAAGRLDPATKAFGGDRIAAVARLQLAHMGEFDFRAAAHREGRRALLERHGAVFRQEKLPDAVRDEGLDLLLGWVLTIVEKVVSDELALRAH